MTKTLANRDLPRYVRSAPDFDVEGYGALSYTPNGYWTGYLPDRLVRVLSKLRDSELHIPMIYSYGTPIAWFDRRFGMWVQPRVTYSITTSKHQGYLWQLGTVSVPWDCGIDEYERYVSLKMVFTGSGTRPGPRFFND